MHYDSYYDLIFFVSFLIIKIMDIPNFGNKTAFKLFFCSLPLPNPSSCRVKYKIHIYMKVLASMIGYNNIEKTFM